MQWQTFEKIFYFIYHVCLCIFITQIVPHLNKNFSLNQLDIKIYTQAVKIPREAANNWYHSI